MPQRTPEEKREYDKVYLSRDNNREKKNAKSRDHYAENRERVLAKTRAYQASHREETKVQKRAYCFANRDRRAAYNRAYWAAHPEEGRAYRRAYNAANREERLVKQRAYDDDAGNQRKARDRAYRWKYGITLEDWEKLFELQKGKCPICKNKFSAIGKRGKRTPVTHHCHSAGHVHGLVCQSCNSAEGLLGTPEVVLALYNYMMQSQLLSYSTVAPA